MRGVYLCALLLVAAVETTWAANSYMILVPRSIGTGSTVHIPVLFTRPVSSQIVNVKLYDREDRLINADEVRIAPPATSTKNVTLLLNIPESMSGSYRMNFTLTGDVSARNTTYVSTSGRSEVILTQTDKAVYKPGETVKFRVFAINATMRLTDHIIDIEIYDPKGNKIAEWMGQRNNQSGGIKGELPLSDMPPLGNWRLISKISSNDMTSTTNFEVKEYVLPKFEVLVTLPSFGKTSDSSLTGTVTANYTFGKPVTGNLKLMVSKPWGSEWHDPKAIQTKMPISGKATFDIPINFLKRLTRYLENGNFNVLAEVTEDITGITQDGEKQITYYKNPYRLEFSPKMSDNFKPGFGPYPVQIKVIQQDGRPVAPPAGNVKITTTYFTDKKVKRPLPQGSVTLLNYDVVSPFATGETIMKEMKMYPLAEDGTAEFTLQIPNNTATFSIKAEYGNEVKTYKDVKRFRSPREKYLRAQMNISSIVKIGDNMTINVVSNTPSTVEASYLVISKDNIVASGRITVNGTLVLPVEKDMVPSGRFVAYFIQPDGEIVADGFNFMVEDIFENKVNLQFNETRVRPGSPINLHVEADPGSLVNVLAVDKSVLLMGDNDITPSKVEQALRTIGDNPWMPLGWGRIPYWEFNSDDVSDIFRQAKLHVLTDANLYNFDLDELNPPTFRATSARMFSASLMSNDISLEMGGGVGGPQGQIRTEFPETWIWKTAIANASGIASFDDVVPDTITNFVANAYAVHSDSGIGVAPERSNVTVFLPFFVNLQLPYAVVRNELAVMQANVFNYRGQDHYVNVKLRASADYQIVSVDISGKETVLTGDSDKCILVKSGTPTPVYFNIRPQKIGTVLLRVQASIAPPVNINDEVIKYLPSKAEGVEKEKNTPVLITNTVIGNDIAETVEIAYPQSLVPGSEKIRVSVIGDIFGPSLKNLGDLVKMPYGCGEQNMINFAPSVFATVYMKTTRRFDTDLVLQEKIKNVLTTGYQRELIYQRNDGSFSAFGDADLEGSLWLTAFVVKSFAQAKSLDMIYIDPEVIAKAVKYIKNKQVPDGSFVNTGTTIHKALHGGAVETLRTLAAYTLIALHEVKRSQILLYSRRTLASGELESAIRNATSFLTDQILELKTDYEKALIAYALQLSSPNCPRCEYLLGELETSANKVNGTDSGKYWKHDSRALQIEQTAYVLLTYTLKGDQNNGLQILNWLVNQRNSRGGFSSTQDTVVALQALSEFAALIYSPDVNMTLTITTLLKWQPQDTKVIQLNSSIHDVLQYVDLDGTVDVVSVAAEGLGLALLDVAQFYNIRSEDETPAYQLNVTVNEETPNIYTLESCVRFNKTGNQSDMAIMDIGAVSGFEPQEDQVSQSPIMKRVEVTANRLIIYFDEITEDVQCVTVPMQRVAIVSDVKPANVIVYSYYEPSERVMAEYIPATMENVNLCTMCPKCCEDKNISPATSCAAS